MLTFRTYCIKGAKAILVYNQSREKKKRDEVCKSNARLRVRVVLTGFGASRVVPEGLKL